MAAQRVLADANVVVCIRLDALLADDNTIVAVRACAALLLERDQWTAKAPGAFELEAIKVGRRCCAAYMPPIASTKSTAGCALGKLGSIRGVAAPAAGTRLGTLGGVPTGSDEAEARRSRYALCFTPPRLLCGLRVTPL